MVVVLGAYVRLSDAGLGCPDWPGCYGRLIAPSELQSLAPEHGWRPLEQGKAWKEMAHRYAAGVLGMLILALLIDAWCAPQRRVALPAALSVLVLIQAALGMWTVTLLLKPLVVVLHLLGGMSVLLLLWWFALRRQLIAALAPLAEQDKRLRNWVIVALTMVYLQISLGGWTSANYAALVCTDFPTCQGRWWPEMAFKEGFTLWRGVGPNYEFGILDTSARTAIHVVHRLGALVTFAIVTAAALACLRNAARSLQHVGVALLVALGVQVSLGIANVKFGLPLVIAAAHNAGAAILLLSLGTALHIVMPDAGKSAGN